MRRGTIQQKRLSQTALTLIELPVVIAIILTMASFAAPIYSRIVTRSHEAVLKDDLFTLRHTPAHTKEQSTPPHRAIHK